MLRMSMLGWVGVAFLIITMLGETVALGQDNLDKPFRPLIVPLDAYNRRTCVVDVRVTDECPDVSEIQCPTGGCSTILGCLSAEGKRVITEYVPKNAGATVKAVRQATEKEISDFTAFRPEQPDSPVVCYEFAFCFCRSLAPEPGAQCIRGELMQANIYSWKADKNTPCLVPIPTNK